MYVYIYIYDVSTMYGITHNIMSLMTYVPHLKVELIHSGAAWLISSSTIQHEGTETWATSIPSPI